MTLTSSLEDFSLAELFRMIDQGRKSGRLTLYASANSQVSNPNNCHHIWFRQGRVIAISNRLDGQGLSSKIEERGWLSQRVIERLNSHSSESPLGLTLKTQGALQAEQLQLLFTSQLQQIWGLFAIHTGQFELDGKAPLPVAEMTGLSLPAMEVAVAGLRLLKNWEGLADALPDGSSGIQSIIQGKPNIRLNALEWQVWEFAKGTVSLEATAKQINQSTAKVQQAAFRLMLAGLVEEVPFVSSTPKLNSSAVELEANKSSEITKQPEEHKPEASEKSKVSNSFLQSLVGFLRSKA